MRMTYEGRGDTLNFRRKGGKVVNGVPETVSISSGETADLDVDKNDPQVQAAIQFGSLRVAPSVAARVAASVAAPPSAGEAQTKRK